MIKRDVIAIVFVIGLGALVSGCRTSPAPSTPVNPYRPVLKRHVVREPVAAPKPTVLPKIDSQPAAVQTPAVTTSLGEAGLEKSERVLRKGDRVQVAIYAPPEPFSCLNVVDEDGRINFPLIGPMVVAGKSCGEAQRIVERAYIDQKIYRTVTVIIVPPESEYAVAGEVIRPGPYPLTRDQTLLQALARAGRYTEYADKTKVYLTRNNDRVEIKLDDIRNGKRKDIVIIPGDVIEVPRSAW